MKDNISDGPVVVVPTYKRPEFLACCLKRICAADPTMPVLIFPDRGTGNDPEVQRVASYYNADIIWVPEHDYYGNTYCTMEALRFAYNCRADLVFYIEDDVMVHEDFFLWHYEQHETFPNVFGTMGWVFNHHAPIVDDILFQPWYYSVGTCFSDRKLELIVKHASPLYYNDMPGYIQETFPSSRINDPFHIAHFEQDGLIQRVLEQDRTQTISAGIARCTHLGSYGYNRGWDAREELFAGARSFEERVERIENFFADPYWRLAVFGREIVEREVGHELPKRSFDYEIRLPGGWSSRLTAEVEREHLPRRIHSVLIPPDAEIVIL